MIAIQALLVVSFSSATGFLFDENNGYSALLGGSIAVLSNVIFAYFLFRYRGAKSAKKITQSMYQGEMLKILWLASSFSLVLIFFRDLKIIPFLMIFMLVQGMVWFSPWLIKTK